jgi:RecA-family ATPase
VSLWEAIHIVLGRALYGLRVHKPGPVVIITAEDSREMLVARLRRMCEAIELLPAALATVLHDVRISDVCGSGFKLTSVVNDIVIAAPMVDVVIAGCRALRPVLVTLDPAISFGIGESRVNDAEQGLVAAARRIRSELNCCVRFVHHTGKVNAREETVDQYTGRGGSAMPDGCRMVAVLQPMKADKWLLATGASLMKDEIGMVLARPKVSYAPPPHPDILICRKGYEFTHRLRDEPDPAGKLRATCDQVLRVLVTDLDKGTYHSKNSLEALNLMPRAELRAVIATLEARGRIEHADRPHKGPRGAWKYLRPVASPNPAGEAK